METEEEYKTTVDEVAQVIYDTDVYEDVKLITNGSGSYDINFLFFKIVVEINTNYLTRLKDYSMKGERKEYLEKQVKNELKYYVMHRKNKAES